MSEDKMQIVKMSGLIVARVDDIAPYMASQPVLCPTGNCSRAAVIRECIRRGLESLERERAAKAPKVAPKVETPIEAPKAEAPKVAKNRRITDRVASDRERAAKAAADVAAVFGGSPKAVAEVAAVFGGSAERKADKGNA